MTTRRDRTDLPADLRVELLDLAILHLRLDKSWEARDLGGETHQLSEMARQYAMHLLQDLADGKRPRVPRRSQEPRFSADERYVSRINRALAGMDNGGPEKAASTLEEAYRIAAGSGDQPADPDSAEYREAKRAWANHWNRLSAAIGPGHRLRRVAPREAALRPDIVIAEYERKFGPPSIPFGISDELFAAVLWKYLRKGKPVPKNYDWYEDLPPDVKV
jgi:hypothetical protein